MNVLVTAGPTREPLDPARYLSNRSSGKMGYAVARVAAARGHKVSLVSGPVALEPPTGVEVRKVETALEMLRAVLERVSWCDVLIMAAAVADWRPAEPSPKKIKKRGRKSTLRLIRNPDILKEAAKLKGNRIFVGFAAETNDLEKEASRKLGEKTLDLIVANDITLPGSGFEVDTNKVTLLSSDGLKVDLPLMSKDAVAERILDWVEDRVSDPGRANRGRC